MSVTIEIVDNFAGLVPLAKQWNALADKFKTPLLGHEWFSAAAEAFCPPGKLFIIVQRSGDEITGIAPLVLNSKFGFERYELLGATLLGEPSGFLFKDSESLANLMKRVSLLRKPVYLNGLSSVSREIDYLKNVNGNASRNSSVHSFASPWIPISTTWEQYYATISPRWRSSIRRAEKRAKEFGDMCYEIITPSPESFEGLLSEVFHVEMSGWKSRVGTASQTHETLGKFFTIYSRTVARLGSLRVAFLRIDGKAVAVQLLIEHASRLWVLKIGYDEAYAKCSPGILLMNEVIHHAFNKQLEAFEMLGTNQQWLNIWPHELHQYEDYVLHRFTPGAMISHGLEVSDRAISKLQTIIAKNGNAHVLRPIVKALITKTIGH